MNLVWLRMFINMKKPIKSFVSLWSPGLIGRLRNLLVYRFVRELDFSDCTFVRSDNSSRSSVWNAALSRMNIRSDTPLTYYEFGVFDGESLKWWAGQNSNLSSQFFGFDSFEGLPEYWAPGRQAIGSYKTTPGSLDGLDERVTLVPGWFSASVPKFFSEHDVPVSTTKVVMFDADLFSSTVCALAGVIMNVDSTDQLWIFDEFIPEEAGALEIFLKGFDLNVEPIASDDLRRHVAFHVKRREWLGSSK